MKITFDSAIIKAIPSFDVIAYTMDVKNQTTSEVTNFIDQVVEEKKKCYKLEEIIKEPKILSARNGYKKLGKDPSHTRVAVENLWRRIIKGQPLYRLGDIIDIGNILSILTRRCVCVVDLDCLVGDVTIRLGTKNDQYEAINRGFLNVDKIPVYQDELSPFGCPSSDTKRTAITNQTKRIYVMIICFSTEDMQNDEQLLLDLFTKYVGATNINKIKRG